MTITIETSANSISKVIAFLIITIGASYLLHVFDMQQLAEINSTSPDVFVESEKQTHQNGFAFDFFVALFMGAFYLGAVEVVAYGVRRVMPKKSDRLLPTNPK
jgi:hypothetical protein